jgi:hypothetical protein
LVKHVRVRVFDVLLNLFISSLGPIFHPLDKVVFSCLLKIFYETFKLLPSLLRCTISGEFLQNLFGRRLETLFVCKVWNHFVLIGFLESICNIFQNESTMVFFKQVKEFAMCQRLGKLVDVLEIIVIFIISSIKDCRIQRNGRLVQ